MNIGWLKWFFVALSVTSVLIAGYFMMSKKHNLHKVMDAALLETGSSVIHPDIKEFDGDNLSWRLQAEKLYEQGKVIVLSKPAIDLYSDKGDVLPITAIQGFFDKQKSIMNFEGKVELFYQGWKLNSEKLDVHQKKEEIRVKSSFVLENEGIRITGKDLQLIRKTGKIRVRQGVHMIILDNRR